MFNRIKQFRRVATRYDKTRKSFEGFLALVAAKNMVAILCQQDLRPSRPVGAWVLRYASVNRKNPKAFHRVG